MPHLIARFLLIIRRVWRGIRLWILRSAFKRCGRNVRFDPDGNYSYCVIEIGNDVFIGNGTVLLATESSIVIGDKVMFGPNVTIMGGDHNSTVVGKFMFDVKAKRPENDISVIIEEDVWVGAGATILKGVRLRRGCIGAAGAIVTREVPPYAIVSGVPARLVSMRFSLKDILKHETLLYPEPQRLSEDDLKRIFDSFPDNNDNKKNVVPPSAR
jgi:acetyltransferase-like isoleucine patch superfamily enzyme